MNVLDLFSGIGGFSLGLERAGMRTVAFCEIEPYCQAVLRKHWPGIPVFPDITKLSGTDIGAAVHVICGGFPCQPFSSAARGRNTASSMWHEMHRIISECRPAWIVCENVVNIDGMALDEMVSDLDAIGYEVAPPFEIPACAVGLDHRRSRLWICGYADRESKPGFAIHAEMAQLPGNRFDARNNREAHGISSRMDRLRALGNAVVPQIAEIIGTAIMRADHADRD